MAMFPKGFVDVLAEGVQLRKIYHSVSLEQINDNDNVSKQVFLSCWRFG